MGINDWPEQDRPRERLAREGSAALSNAELLAIFLRVGVRGRSAVQLGSHMLEHFGSLQALLHATPQEFSQVHGLGLAKYAQLQAVMELSRRAISEQFFRHALCSPDVVKTYLRGKFGLQAYESFVVLFVDVKNRLIDAQEMFRGTLTQLSVQYLRNYHGTILWLLASSRTFDFQPLNRSKETRTGGSCATLMNGVVSTDMCWMRRFP